MDLTADKTGEITRRSIVIGGAAFIVGGVLATPISRNTFGTLGWWFFNVLPPDARLRLPETIVKGELTPELIVRGVPAWSMAEVTVDGRPYPTSGPLRIDTGALDDGTHTLKVSVRDGSIRRNVRTVEGQFRSDNSPPILTLDTKQPAGAQGTTMLVQVRTNEPAELDLDLGAKGRLRFAQEGKAYVALVGFDPSTVAGEIPGKIVARDEAGNESSSLLKINVARGDFFNETIDLAPEMLKWLTSGLYDTELQQLGEFFNPNGTPRLWDGVFDAPAKGPIASGYGIDRTYNGGQARNRHLGTDFDVPIGTPVGAAAKGAVVFADKLEVRGNAVIVDHGLGIHTAYYHMSRLDLKAGTQVNKGQQLGLSGATGLATAPHLHWEVRIAGTAVDPLEWLKKKML